MSRHLQLLPVRLLLLQRRCGVPVVSAGSAADVGGGGRGGPASLAPCPVPACGAASDDDDGIDRNPCKFPDLLFAIAFSAMVVAMIYAAFYYQYAGRVDFDDVAAEDAAGNLFYGGGPSLSNPARRTDTLAHRRKKIPSTNC